VNGPGRIRCAVRRAAIAAGGRVFSTTHALLWAYPRRRRPVENSQRRAVRAALAEFCELVAVERRGRSFVCLWRAVGPVEEGQAAAADDGPIVVVASELNAESRKQIHCEVSMSYRGYEQPQRALGSTWETFSCQITPNHGEES
jgi:hypothetical protein